MTHFDFGHIAGASIFLKTCLIYTCLSNQNNREWFFAWDNTDLT